MLLAPLTLTPPFAPRTVPPSPAARARDDRRQPAAARVTGEVRGALLLEQSGDALPLLTNRALLILIGASLGALVFAGAVLFAFAGVLGLRIRRQHRMTLGTHPFHASDYIMGTPARAILRQAPDRRTAN